MTKISEIMDFFESFAPLSSADDYDNPGLLVGNKDTEISKVLLALDITSYVVEEAKEIGAELIISHHPVIFNPIKSLDDKNPVYLMAKYNISALCMHTNLDKSNPGVTTTLADALKLKNQELHLNDYLIIGELDKKYTSEELALYIKDKLDLSGVKFTKGKDIKRIAVSPGGAGDNIFKLSQYPFDAFITGDMKHHEFIYARENNISAYEAGHYNTEHPVVFKIQELLSEKYNNIDFIISKSDINPNEYK